MQPMQLKLLLPFVLILFAYFIISVVDIMIKEQSTIIRFIGYLLAILMAMFVFYITLYYYFDIKLFEVFL